MPSITANTHDMPSDTINPLKAPMSQIRKFLSDNQISIKESDTSAMLRIKVKRRLIQNKFNVVGDISIRG